MLNVRIWNPPLAPKNSAERFCPQGKASSGCAGILGVKRASTSACSTVRMCRERMIMAGKISRELFGKTDER